MISHQVLDLHDYPIMSWLFGSHEGLVPWVPSKRLPLLLPSAGLFVLPVPPTELCYLSVRVLPLPLESGTRLAGGAGKSP